jgi:beta-N-acetylhexosaminidase
LEQAVKYLKRFTASPRSMLPQLRSIDYAILAVVFLLVIVTLGLCFALGYSTLWYTRSTHTEVAEVTATATTSIISPTDVTSTPLSSLPLPASPTIPAMPSPQATSSPLPSIPPSSTSPPAVDVDALLAQMSLEQKIGQMIISGVPGRTLSPEAENLIQRYAIGGVVYFGPNTQAPSQVLALSQDLQRVAAGSGRGIPLMIAVDHEGGRIFRFAEGLTHFPSAMALGSANSVDLTYQAAFASAQELLSVGINVSLGPVVDVNDEPLNPVIGTRSFGGFPDRVSGMGVAYIQGLQNRGVIATAKHFPGHGSTTTDSHASLPEIDKSLDQLSQTDLPPFQAAIKADVGMILVGHISNRIIDPSGRPATLSPVLVQQLLRDQMGYNGVVMTDAMSMGAIAGYSVSEAAVRAAQAGCDLLAYTSPEAAVAGYNALLSAARRGSIPPSRIDEAVRRILLLKARFGLFSQPLPPGGDIPYDEHLSLSRRIAGQALAAGGGLQAPVIQSQSVLLVTPDTLLPGSATGDGVSLLGELLQAQGVKVDEYIYEVDNIGQTAVIQGQVLRAISSFPQAIIVTWNARLRQAGQGETSQINLLNAMLTSGTPVIVVAGDSPFDLSLVGPNQPALATFGALQVQIEALAAALLANSMPPGVMPVNITR